MDLMLQDASRHKRYFWKFASKGLYPTIIASVGFAYIGIPSELQQTIRGVIPLSLRKFLLEHLSSNNWTLLFLLITVLCAIWGALGSHATSWFVKEKYKKIKKENQQLKQENESKNINTYKLFSNFLFDYSEKFKLSTDERISLYKLDMELFSCIGRYSDNELYNRKPNRFYPKSQGVISKAWAQGKYVDTNAPEPNDNIDEWVDFNVKEYGFDKEEAKDIRMKCRAMFGLRLKNTSNETIAVLIFESKAPNGLPLGKIESTFSELEKKKLCSLIESLQSHIPTLENANAEGF